MEVHAADAAGGAAIAGHEYLETVVHSGKLGLVGAPGGLRTSTATVEKAGEPPEDDKVLGGVADTPASREEIVFPAPKKRLELGQFGLGQVMAIGVTGGESRLR